MDLARTTAVLDAQREAGLHPGACVVATRWGEPAGTAAVGEARPGVAMGPTTVTAWFSMSKLTVALRAAVAWERGALELDDPVVRHVPEAMALGERTTVRHLLTHTAGVHAADSASAGGRLDGWDAEVARIAGTAPPPGWVPGRMAAYSLRAGFHLLAEVVRRAEADTRPWARIVAEDIFAPLGMAHSWMALDDDAWAASRPDAATMWASPPAPATRRPVDERPERAAVCQPGASGRGRVSDVVRLVECLLLGGAPLLRPPTAEAVVARHRTGLRDATFGAVLDWGLGVILDSKVHGRDLVPYGYGAHASPRTFGHGGSQSSGALADPEHGLAAVLCCTGMPGEAAHIRRAHEVWTALYDDLGLAVG